MQKTKIDTTKPASSRFCPVREDSLLFTSLLSVLSGGENVTPKRTWQSRFVVIQEYTQQCSFKRECSFKR